MNPETKNVIPDDVTTVEEQHLRDVQQKAHDMGFLTGAFLTMHEKVKEEAKHYKEHDQLTGLKNQVTFQRELENISSRSTEESPLAVAFIDLDDFSGVNEAFTHPGADLILTEVADHLYNSFRPDDAVIGRIGGDEFGLIFHLTQRPDRPYAKPFDRFVGLKTRVEEVTEEFITAHPEIREKVPDFGISVGFAFDNKGYRKADDLKRSADVDMYKNKRSSKEDRRHSVAEVH